jgi:hypothetical protein
MADDENEGTGGTSAPAKRSRSGSSRPRKSAKRGAAAKKSARRRTVEDEQGKEPEHAEASDRTVPGGVYFKADGRVTNAHGDELDPETYEKLDPDESEEAREARLAELDERLDEAESE